jgi:hypothetical protein
VKRLVILFLAISACTSMPANTVRTADTRPGIAVEGAPAGSKLFIDGNAAGDASAFNGQPGVVRVEAGTHEVDIRDASGRVLFRQKVFVDSETKTVVVH